MIYLIDGHNLIAKMDDISLDDPNDEAKLVIRLRSWAAAGRRRQLVVIFDGGLPGGKSRRLSSSNIKVIFASAGKTADSLLIRRVRQARNPAEFRLISSDETILAAARSQKMPFWRSEQFVQRLEAERPIDSAPTATADGPKLSEAEIAEWLDLFGPVPQRKSTSRPKKPPPPAKSASDSQTKRDTRPLPERKTADDRLSSEEIEEWLRFFGEDS